MARFLYNWFLIEKYKKTYRWPGRILGDFNKRIGKWVVLANSYLTYPSTRLAKETRSRRFTTGVCNYDRRHWIPKVKWIYLNNLRWTLSSWIEPFVQYKGSQINEPYSKTRLARAQYDAPLPSYLWNILLSIIFWQTQEFSTPHSTLHQYVIMLLNSIKIKNKNIATDTRKRY